MVGSVLRFVRDQRGRAAHLYERVVHAPVGVSEFLRGDCGEQCIANFADRRPLPHIFLPLMR